MVNRLVSREDVESILNGVKNIGDSCDEMGRPLPLRIRGIEWYQRAFVHKSYIHESDVGNYRPTESNEVLEFLGDAVINVVVGKYLVERFDDQQEGFLTKIRTNIVRTNMLHRFARFLCMGRFILLSPQIERLTNLGVNRGRQNPRLYEDVFEAFVGAIVRDFETEDDPMAGTKYAYRFLISVVEHVVDFAELVLKNENYKDTLQRYFQSRRWPNPLYIDLLESGPSHMRSFTKGVFIRREHLDELADDVKDVVRQYHLELTRRSDDNTSSSDPLQEAIESHAKSTNTFLLGLATANKKAVAEQNCSSIALSNIKIHCNWESGGRR